MPETLPGWGAGQGTTRPRAQLRPRKHLRAYVASCEKRRLFIAIFGRLLCGAMRAFLNFPVGKKSRMNGGLRSCIPMPETLPGWGAGQGTTRPRAQLRPRKHLRAYVASCEKRRLFIAIFGRLLCGAMRAFLNFPVGKKSRMNGGMRSCVDCSELPCPGGGLQGSHAPAGASAHVPKRPGCRVCSAVKFALVLCAV